MKLSSSQVGAFQMMIFDWWKTHRRDLPWRHTHNPYRILISEVMLQQTQVLRVLPKYVEFIEAFPTVFALAQSSPAGVLRVWKGMGYNRRALYLQKAAQMIVDRYSGVFPDCKSELLKLPGLGIYTAGAVLVFAYKKDIALVDTNIRQIITHYFFSGLLQKPIIIQNIADQLVPKGKSWEWHQALMDYGSLALKVSGVKCHVSRKKIIPFKDTNRFIRGRIIDELRSKEYEKEVLIELLSKKYKKSDEFVAGQIGALAKEGLIQLIPNGIVRLPE